MATLSVAPKLHLFTSYFLVKKLAHSLSLGVDVGAENEQARTAVFHRQAEYLDCLRRNLESPLVAHITLLVEGTHAMEHLRRSVGSLRHFGEKVSTLLVPRQPTYGDLFDVANRCIARNEANVTATGRRHHLSIVCNSDIHVPLHHHHFDVSAISHLFEEFDRARLHLRRSERGGERQDSFGNPVSGTDAAAAPSSSPAYRRLVLALTRYECDASSVPTTSAAAAAPLIHDYRGSHDAFVFCDSMPRTFIDAVQHPQNCYKAENVVIHELRHSASALVLNPCLDVRIVHQHESEVRQWLPAVDEERYGRAPPTTLRQALDDVRSLT